MGVAKYACSGGCSCPPGFINALKTGEQISVDEYHLVNVTQARDCVVKLENTQAGKKFKLIALMLSTSRPYQQIADQHRELWRAKRRDEHNGGRAAAEGG